MKIIVSIILLCYFLFSIDKNEEKKVLEMKEFVNSFSTYTIHNSEIKKIIMAILYSNFSIYQDIVNEEKTQFLKNKLDEEFSYYVEANHLCQLIFLNTESIIEFKNKNKGDVKDDRKENYLNLENCNKNLKRKEQYINTVKEEVEKIEKTANEDKFKFLKLI